MLTAKGIPKQQHHCEATHQTTQPETEKEYPMNNKRKQPETAYNIQTEQHVIVHNT